MKPRKQDEKILSDQYSYFEPIISDSCDIKFDGDKRRIGSIFISHEEICFIRKEEDYIFKISLSDVVDYNTVVTIWKNQASLTLNDNRKITFYFVTNSPLTGFISILKLICNYLGIRKQLFQMIIYLLMMTMNKLKLKFSTS